MSWITGPEPPSAVCPVTLVPLSLSDTPSAVSTQIWTFPPPNATPVVGSPSAARTCGIAWFSKMSAASSIAFVEAPAPYTIASGVTTTFGESFDPTWQFDCMVLLPTSNAGAEAIGTTSAAMSAGGVYAARSADALFVVVVPDDGVLVPPDDPPPPPHALSANAVSTDMPSRESARAAR